MSKRFNDEKIDKKKQKPYAVRAYQLAIGKSHSKSVARTHPARMHASRSLTPIMTLESLSYDQINCGRLYQMLPSNVDGRAFNSSAVD